MMRFIGKAIAYGRAAVWAALALTLISASSVAQKSGGILKIPHGAAGKRAGVRFLEFAVIICVSEGGGSR